MKRILSLTLVLVLLLSLVPGALAAKRFDYQTILGSRPGFARETRNGDYWYYYNVYVKTNPNGMILIALAVYGEDGGSNPEYATLEVSVMDNNNEIISPVQSITFDIDGDKYSYDAMKVERNCSVVVIGEKGEELLEALRDCNPSNLTIKVVTEDDSYRFEVDRTKFKNTLMEFSRIYTKYDIGSYIDDTSWIEDMEEEYPLRINGDLA